MNNRSSRKKNGFFKKFVKGIWDRIGIMQKLRNIIDYIKDHFAHLLSNSLIDKIENFIWEKGFKGAANKIIEICEKEGIDPRYHLVRAVPEEEQYDFAKSMHFERAYTEDYNAPECFF